MTPAQGRLCAQIAANTRWSQHAAHVRQSEAARAAMLARFEREVDPDRLLDPRERTKLVRAAARRLSAQLNAAKARKRAAGSAGASG